MNRSELVEQVAWALGVSKRQAREQVDSVLAAIGAALAHGEEVKLADFGTFALAFRPARDGVINGRSFSVPARSVVRFRAAKDLAERLPVASA